MDCFAPLSVLGLFFMLDAKYKYDKNFNITYLDYDEFERLVQELIELRKSKEFSIDTVRTIHSIFKSYYKNSIYRQELIDKFPRLIAQKFIGRKKIREFIFKRDGYSCLKCGNSDKLTIDHILPVSKKGENKISNLQTLCKSCNSKKSSSYKDYRNGSR